MQKVSTGKKLNSRSTLLKSFRYYILHSYTTLYTLYIHYILHYILYLSGYCVALHKTLRTVRGSTQKQFFLTVPLLRATIIALHKTLMSYYCRLLSLCTRHRVRRAIRIIVHRVHISLQHRYFIFNHLFHTIINSYYYHTIISYYYILCNVIRSQSVIKYN